MRGEWTEGQTWDQATEQRHWEDLGSQGLGAHHTLLSIFLFENRHALLGNIPWHGVEAVDGAGLATRQWFRGWVMEQGVLQVILSPFVYV